VTLRFSLGSLNLHCGRDRWGRPFPIATAIRALATDVIVLQEHWRPDGSASLLADVAAELGYDKPIELDVFPDTRLRALNVVPDERFDEEGSAGLAILTRVPLTVIDHVPLGLAPRDHAERVAQVALVGDRSGPRVRLVNTHLTHRLAHGPGQLRRLASAIPGRHRPTVIAGDLNMFRPTIRLARGYRGVVRGRTWPAWRPAFQIDHVLASRGIRASGAQVGDPIGSDHLPIRVTIHSG
jgi:endonuclease/exonuclease/phosphatase family metal-dependent hydrolase